MKMIKEYENSKLTGNVKLTNVHITKGNYLKCLLTVTISTLSSLLPFRRAVVMFSNSDGWVVNWGHHVQSRRPADFQSPDCPETGRFSSRTPITIKEKNMPLHNLTILCLFLINLNDFFSAL